MRLLIPLTLSLIFKFPSLLRLSFRPLYIQIDCLLQAYHIDDDNDDVLLF